MNATTNAGGLRVAGRSRRVLAAGAAALLLLAAAAWLWSRGRDQAQAGWVTEPVDRGPIDVVVTATGTVNPVKTVQVGTYVSGPIKALYVDYNSPVHKGQLVAKIDPRPFEVKVAEAKANLANARAKADKSRADLAFKKLTFERNQTLRGRNLIAQNDLDTARSDRDQAQAQLALDLAAVEQAQAQLDEAAINLGYTDITSPVDGVVVSRNVDVGQTVAASFQTPTLFQIAEDLTKMQVDSNVSESDIGGVHEGQGVRFTVDAFPGRDFEGRVVQVRNAPLTLQNVVTYDVVVEVANRDLALKPGMTATVTITTDHRDDALRVPLRALRFRPEAEGSAAPEGGAARGASRPEAAPAVWVEGAGGELERVEIKTGLRNDRFAEVVSGGLAAGQNVVVAARKPSETTAAPAQSPFQPRRPR